MVPTRNPIRHAPSSLSSAKCFQLSMPTQRGKKFGEGKEYPLTPLGDAGPVINAGGLFPYAIKTGMINKLED